MWNGLYPCSFYSHLKFFPMAKQRGWNSCLKKKCFTKCLFFRIPTILRDPYKSSFLKISSFQKGSSHSHAFMYLKRRQLTLGKCIVPLQSWSSPWIPVFAFNSQKCWIGLHYWNAIMNRQHNFWSYGVTVEPKRKCLKVHFIWMANKGDDWFKIKVWLYFICIILSQFTICSIWCSICKISC